MIQSTLKGGWKFAKHGPQGLGLADLPMEYFCDVNPMIYSSTGNLINSYNVQNYISCILFRSCVFLKT